MNHSEISLFPPALLKKNKVWLVAFVVVAVLGFADAVYLTALHYLSVVPPCTILNGCEQVTTSVFATIGPVPIALVGTVYYLLCAVIGLAALDMQSARLARWATYFSPVGFLTSLYLVYLQIAVIGALCIYCLASAGTSTLLFLLGLALAFSSERTPHVV